ncbi:MAG: GDP-mannose 4,6-dehydratase [Anaerolineae bacterium]|nr:GDP-mannose 4,6-dehydratase [Anaerolineae bacterium]MDQ7037483.1 GDP-mannose 4,6-dehydratase [Anaerolineae bacterium]
MSLAGQTVVVTGGAGFIGSMLVRLLLDSGATVRVVDNLVNGKHENLADIANDERLTLHLVDIRDTQPLKVLMEDAHIVFNLAVLGVRHSLHSPHENHEVNATATLHMLSAAREVGVGRYVYVSTSEVYGTARTVPMTELHPTFPMTVYGASKLAGECYTRAFWETYRYPTVVVRPFNSYGIRSHHEGDSGEVIPKFLLRCMADKALIIFGDGRQTRDFTFVEDSARGILLAGTSDKAVGETINIGSNHEITINDLADTVKAVVGKANAEIIHDEPRPGDVLRLYADSSKAGKLLGFEPRVTMTEGLQRLKAWYEAQSLSAEELLEAEKVRNWEV